MSPDHETIVPLRERKKDIFFVVAFSFFVFSSLCSDAFHGLGLLDDTSFWGRANLAYGAWAGDDFLLADNDFARFSTLVSGFVYGPFYVVLVYAFVTGRNWIRLPALVYVGAMMHGWAEFMWWEYTLGMPPRNPLVFWSFYLPYGVVPILLAIRMWRPNPFSPAAQSVEQASVYPPSHARA